MTAGGFAALADAIEGDWLAQARPEQIAPAGDWSTWIICGGRAFGKTRAGAEWVRSLAEAGSVARIALVAPTAADCRDTQIEGQSGLLAIAPNGNRPTYEPSKRRLVWPNGVQAALFSSEEPDRLRGPQFGAAWCDELAAFRNIKETWDNLQFGLRLGKRPRQVITTTPRPIKLLRELLKREGDDVRVTRGSTYENRANLAPSFFSQIVTAYEGTRIGRQELLAEMLTDTPGALFSYEMLEQGRVAKADIPTMRRIVVGVDPAMSADGDETGIVVCGLGADDHGYVLEDASGNYSPDAWGRKTVGLFHKWGADRVIAETNQGGDLVAATLRTVDPNISYRGVFAKRGKTLRAEPVAALYEQHRVHHVGSFPELEDQMCSFASGSMSSPDRLDSLVHTIVELMLGPTNDGLIGYYRELCEQQDGAADAGSASAPLPASETIPLVAPEGCSVIFDRSGRRHLPDGDRLVRVAQEDVDALERIGFTKLKLEVCS